MTAAWKPAPVPPGLLARWTDGKRVIDVSPLLTGTARLHIGPVDVEWYDDEW